MMRDVPSAMRYSLFKNVNSNARNVENPWTNMLKNVRRVVRASGVPLDVPTMKASFLRNPKILN